jgi:hypothetical protein
MSFWLYIEAKNIYPLFFILMSSSLILPIPKDVQFEETDSENEGSDSENENVSLEETEIHTIQKDNFRITLYRTHIKDILYRIDATDGDDKYSSRIDIGHFNGQECRECIQACPMLLEKLFKIGTVNILIRNENMICEFEGNIISAKITLARVVETQIELMMKKINRQDMENSKLRIRNEELNNEVKSLVENMKKFSDSVDLLHERLSEINESRFESKYNEEYSELDGKIQVLTQCMKKFETEKLATDQKKADDKSQVLTQCRTFSDRLNKAENEITSQKKELFEFGSRIIGMRQKESFPREILGKWKFNNKIKDWSMTLRETIDNGFVMKRCHLGDNVFDPSETEWRNGVFYWKIKKSRNHTTDSQYCYNTSIPHIIVDISNPQAVETWVPDPLPVKERNFIPEIRLIDDLEYTGLVKDSNFFIYERNPRTVQDWYPDRQWGLVHAHGPHTIHAQLKDRFSFFLKAQPKYSFILVSGKADNNDYRTLFQGERISFDSNSFKVSSKLGEETWNF